MKIYTFLLYVLWGVIILEATKQGCEYLENHNWNFSKINIGVFNDVDDVVYIKGLNNFNQSDLVKAENILEGYYNIQCTIDGSIDLNNEFYNSNGLKCSEALGQLEISGKKVFYITNEKLTLNEEYPSVRGCAAGNGTTAIVSTQTLKSTLIHEYAHLSGLDHCTTDNCALEITKGNGDELCSKCESKIKK